MPKDLHFIRFRGRTGGGPVPQNNANRPPDNSHMEGQLNEATSRGPHRIRCEIAHHACDDYWLVVIPCLVFFFTKNSFHLRFGRGDYVNFYKFIIPIPGQMTIIDCLVAFQ